MAPDPMEKEVAEARASGDLAGATAAATRWVKARPAQAAPRLALAESLIRGGAYERADAQLDLVASQDPKMAVRMALLRQLLRAEQSRSEVMAGKALPELLFDPDETIAAALSLLVDLNSGMACNTPESVHHFHVNGGADAVAFRDLDDRFAGLCEILSSTGKYFWIPLASIQRLEFRPVGSLFEQLWRPCDLEVANGPDGVVFWPMLYPSRADDSDAQRLGRATDWIGVQGISLGQGLRCFLAGDDIVTSHDLESLACTEAVLA